MLQILLVFRAKFKTSYGSSSTLLAVKGYDEVEAAIEEYERRTGGTFIEISNPCEMTPSLYVKGGEINE